jgi:hypothetical protein
LPLALGIIPLKLMNHIRFAANNDLISPCFDGVGLFFKRALSVCKSRQPVRQSTFLEWIRLSRETE